MGVHFIRTVLKLNTAFQSTTFNFKMKVLVVCLVGAALVGMGAATSLEKVEGETGASYPTAPYTTTIPHYYPTAPYTTTTPHYPYPTTTGRYPCKYAGHLANANICAYTCRR